MVRLVWGIIAALLLAGCSTRMAGVPSPSIGPLVLTRSIVPYTRDLDDTPVSDAVGKGLVIRFKEPFSGYGISAEFNSNAVGDIASKQKLTKVCFIDMEELNILGIYRERRLHVYGK